MAFDSLSNKLQEALSKLKRKGTINEKDVKEVMREVKMALLEADVNFKVVKNFIKTVSERAVGQEVLESLTPGQHVVKIVNEELTALMGTTESKITFSSHPPTVIMMVGLQGAGKTTTSGKLGGLLKKQGKKPLLVAADIYRPAAIKQLQVVGEKLGLPVFTMGAENPVKIAEEALVHAKAHHYDVVIIDTAGRLHINDELMDEVFNIKNSVKPHEILLVVDAMTGQDAVTVAEAFDSKLGIDGVVLTKLDGDTRGGAALSVRAVTNKPIKFVGMGEKLEDLESFHPDRMASRILGMGDILSLIEKAQANIDEKKAMELEKKIREQSFTFEDYLEQLQQIKSMGPLNQILNMLPGMGNLTKKMDVEINDKEVDYIQAIIRSMTKYERTHPHVLNGSRKKRIAQGSGRPIQEVNKLVKNHEQMQKMMKQFSDMSKGGKKGKFKFPFL